MSNKVVLPDPVLPTMPIDWFFFILKHKDFNTCSLYPWNL